MPIRRASYTMPVPAGAEIMTDKSGNRFARFKLRGQTIRARLTKDGKRCRVETDHWNVRFKDEHGRWKEVKGYTDKEATLSLERELTRRADRRRQGIDDPFEDHARRPILDHLADFETSLASRRLDDKHVSGVVGRVRAVIEGCGFKRIGDVDPVRVEAYLKGMQDRGLSVQTCNHHLSGIKQFCRWLVVNRRMAASPVIHLGGGNVETDRRRVRRALSADEVQRLLGTVATSETVVVGMAGSDRFVVYYVALGTGLRASEIASLRPESFDLGADVPVVVVEARYSKRRKRDEIPLRPDLVAVLRDYLTNKPAGQPVWPSLRSDRTALILRGDLAEARAAWIAEAADDNERAERERSDFLAYQNAAGGYADFHAQRHTYATVVYSTLPGKIGRELVRHSSEALADRYTHLRVSDTGAAAASLPPVLPEKPAGQESARATGTYGRDGREQSPAGSALTKRSLGPDTQVSPTDRPAAGPVYLPIPTKTGDTAWHSMAQNDTTGTGGGAEEETPQVVVPSSQTLAGKADGEGFEPPLDFRPEQFSRLPP